MSKKKTGQSPERKTKMKSYERLVKNIGCFNYGSLGMQNAHPTDKHFNLSIKKLEADKELGSRNVYFTTENDSLKVKYATVDRCIKCLMADGTLEYLCNRIDKKSKAPKEGLELECDVRDAEGDDAPAIGHVLLKNGEVRETHRFQMIVTWRDNEYANRYTQMPFEVISMMPLNDYEWEEEN